GPEPRAGQLLRDVLVREHDPRPAVLAERTEDRGRGALLVERLARRALRDVRLQVPEEELRLDRLAVVAPREPGDELADRRTADVDAERDGGACRSATGVRDRSLRVRDRAEFGGADERAVPSGLEDERCGEGRSDDGVRGIRGE